MAAGIAGPFVGTFRYSGTLGLKIETEHFLTGCGGSHTLVVSPDDAGANRSITRAIWQCVGVLASYTEAAN